MIAAGDLLLEPARREVRERALPPMNETPVVEAELGPDAGMIGAAAMARIELERAGGLMPGALIVCPTPIGNLDDVTPRVREALVSADYIACEDTRRTGGLLDKLGIRPAPRLISNHEGNEAARATELAQRIERGDTVALVSDAGMPAISDPGYRLIRRCIERDLEVTVLPGPSVVPVALVASGLPTDRWRFEGFLPKRAGGDGAGAALGRDRGRLRVPAPGRRVAGGAGGDRARPPGGGLPRADQDARGGLARLAWANWRAASAATSRARSSS